MVFLSLLLSTELSVLFNSAEITTHVRQTLSEGDHFQISFWAGFMILVSALLTLLSLIATFTAWAMVNAVDEVNVHCIFRSSIGQYAAELPGRLIVCSIYTFLISFLLFFFLLLPTGTWSILLLCLAVSLFIHTVATLSQLGRLIVHSGAMGKRRIFEAQYEQTLLPQSLHTQLLTKAKANLANNTSIRRQYKLESQIPPMDRNYNEEEMIQLLQAQRNHSNHHSSNIMSTMMTATPYRRRADSTVRFEDEQEISPEPAFSSYNNNNNNNNNHSSSWSSTTPASQEDKPTTSRASPVYYRESPPSNQQLQQRPLPARGAEPSSLLPPSFQNTSSSSIDQWLKQSTETINNDDHGDNDPTLPLDGSSQTSRPHRHRPLPPLAATTPHPHHNNHLLITEEERLFNMDYGSDFNKDDDDSPTSATTDDTTHEQSSLLGHSHQSPAGAVSTGNGGSTSGSKSSTSSEQARGYGSSLVHVDQIGMMKQQDRSSPSEKKWSG